MSDIKDLIKKRASIKGRITMFVNFINTLKGELSPTQKTELELRIVKIDQLLGHFDQIQSSIEFSVDSSEEAQQFSEREEFENQCYGILAKAKQILKCSVAKEDYDDDDVHSCVSGEAPSVVRLTKTSKGVKLPTIQVPKFSGQYQDWLEFRDTFLSLIHENDNIGDIQKFHYLRASLEGGAAQVIRSLGFSSSNYRIAWDLLCDRYNNKKVLIQNHIQSLFGVEQIKRESASAIRTIIDTFSKNLRSLESLGEPTSHWDTLIIYLINSKLDSKTCREWEEHKTLLDQIKLSDITTFLKNRADLLETLHIHSGTTDKPKQKSDHVKVLLSTNTNTYIPKCPLCKNSHRIYMCDTFLNQSVTERAESVRKLKLCMNCLRSGHQVRNCISSSCTKCSLKHNTLLHDDLHTQKQDVKAPVDRATTLSAHMTEPVLLSTAVIHMFGSNNQLHEVRAVLDSGSQASFMTEQLLHKLNLDYTQTQTSVLGINNTITQITKRCDTYIRSKVNSFKVKLSFLVLPNITNLCSNKTGIPDLRISSHIILADPEYYSPSNVDLLLGADIFWDLLESNQIRLGTNCPILQETKLGYIVSGPTSGLNTKCSNKAINQLTLCNFTRNMNANDSAIQEQLSKFWIIEETYDTSKPVYSFEERLCEQHFINNFKRMPDGRFSVAIPLKESETRLGESFNRALKCFLSLERKLQNQPQLKQMYTDFINEYKELGHMTLISNNLYTTRNSYFLPHHGVLRENSDTTKLRAVFNASAATSTGVSLNDIQMVGPTIQNDLFSILIRFRHFSYVMTGDIEKMYRQVLIHENQRHLQNIIWRDNPNKELEIYQLNTVTYGTASAPFLAVRCLKQLAVECKDSFISDIISNDFYVDDLVTGAQSISQLSTIRDNICQVLSSGRFNLRKIRSNIPNFEFENTKSCVLLNLGQQNSTNTLGLGWLPSSDMLYFSHTPSQSGIPSKRSVLSTIGQIFDPLGLLTVFVIQAKIILQKLWLHKVSWDEPLPAELAHTWDKFTSNLQYLKDLNIPRCVTCEDPDIIEIHTFCDSSQDAYGACLFVRSISKNNKIEVRLLCAKSKVAPLKPLTIPRLELCGALVAARLTRKVLSAFRLPVDRCVLWTDSSVILGWLKTSPLKLKMFVKNRISEIQELTHNFEWRHVRTQCNPADLLTRGVNMSQIHTLDLWWTGPSFLHESESHWPKINFKNDYTDLPEVVSNIASSHGIYQPLINMNSFSKLLTLKRSMALALRFLHNCKTHDHERKLTGSLTVTELDYAFKILLRDSQIQSFEEYAILKQNYSLPNKNSLLHLSPFMDEFGLIRVGGRLKNSQFDFDKKHPVLISCKHPIAKLIFKNEHNKLFHAGPQLLLSSIRQQFWPLGGRNMARQVVHNCHSCIRMKARVVNPIMGQLPEQRLSPGYPFQTTGVDYAGPILAADRRGRGCKLIKVYIAVFVCFTTKAIHLELVTELTKDAYIAALRRFIARRSKPSAMFSDNGTQFVGAKNEIQAFIKNNNASLSESMANEGIDFKFIPAYAPHFGGVWEAGVKSTKHHLFRVLQNARLTFEELYTTLVQIEAILNSRPLSPISSDPDDLTPLTPGHFLVGRPLTALPSPSFVNVNPNRLQRWERTEQLRQHFWDRWQKEYVSELQQKTKWKSSNGKLQEGTLVLIKQDGLPPMKWKIGRVKRVYPGSDGFNRVADIQTCNGIIRRAFNRICPLPMDDKESVETQAFNVGGHVKDDQGT